MWFHIIHAIGATLGIAFLFGAYLFWGSIEGVGKSRPTTKRGVRPRSTRLCIPEKEDSVSPVGDNPGDLGTTTGRERDDQVDSRARQTVRSMLAVTILTILGLFFSFWTVQSFFSVHKATLVGLVGGGQADSVAPTLMLGLLGLGHRFGQGDRRTDPIAAT